MTNCGKYKFESNAISYGSQMNLNFNSRPREFDSRVIVCGGQLSCY